MSLREPESCFRMVVATVTYTAYTCYMIAKNIGLDVAIGVWQLIGSRLCILCPLKGFPCSVLASKVDYKLIEATKENQMTPKRDGCGHRQYDLLCDLLQGVGSGPPYQGYEGLHGAFECIPQHQDRRHGHVAMFQSLCRRTQLTLQSTTRMPSTVTSYDEDSPPL